MDLCNDKGASVVLAAALAQTREGVLLVDASGRIRFLNPSAEKICGRRRAELLGQPLASIWNSVEPPQRGARMNDLHDWKPEFPQELDFGGDQSPMRVELSHSTVMAGQTVWHLFLLRQVTDPIRQAWSCALPVPTDVAGQAVIGVNAMGRITHVSPLMLEWLGYARHELIGMAWRRLLVPTRSNRKAWRRLATVDAGTGGHYEEWQLRPCHGAGFWVSGETGRIREGSGKYGGHVTRLVRRPDGRRLRALQVEVLEQSIRRRPIDEIMNLICWRLGSLANDLAAAVVLIDEAGRVCSVAAPDLPANYGAALNGISIRSPMPGAVLAAHRAQPHWTPDIRRATEWMLYCGLLADSGLNACWSLPIRSKGDRILGVLCLHMADMQMPTVWYRHLAETCAELCALVAERERLHHDLPRISQPCQVRNALWWQIDRAMEQAVIDSAPLAFMLANMDGFRQVNERLGRAAGDRLLEVVADCFREQLRPLDLSSRLGADEFVMVLPGCDAINAHAVVRRLMRALEKPIRFEKRLLQLSASFGISLYPQDGLDGEMLHQQAITALEQAKRAGGDSYRFCSLLV